ncbi:MAG: hypothetical protein HKO81_10680 [Flavobacteriaceae bacterium]|nr:outer membrane protein transport protein [Bacteroidia bacterium]NNL17092.1 hypothetical protein [Flavobacteriaceae bacterium]
MIKKLLFVIIAIFAFNIQAQEGTTSPYSFYGIGSLKFKGTVENRSMGGLSIYTDSIHINLRNPASYAGLDLASFGGDNRPVKFTVGGSNNSLKLITDDAEEKTASTTFDYLALGIPIGKFGLGFGLMPYTSVGYKLESYNGDDITNRYRGEGGLNKAFLTLAYQVTKELSIGIDANYDFGNIQNSSIAFLYDSDGNPLQFQSREENRSDLSGLNYNFGLSYKKMITPKLELITGITYAPEFNLSSINQRSFSTIQIFFNGFEDVQETIDTTLSDDERETDLTIPSRLSFGAGLGQPKKWFLGAEYTSQNTSEFYNDFLGSAGSVYEDGSTFSFGGFIIPNYKSLTSYWKRIVYRAGVKFENTGLNINSETINEFGISFGVGLPVGRVFSNTNFGLEIGKRGTTNNNLIKENFINVQLSLSLNDRWFEKRKFD